MIRIVRQHRLGPDGRQTRPSYTDEGGAVWDLLEVASQLQMRQMCYDNPVSLHPKADEQELTVSRIPSQEMRVAR